MQWNLLTLKGWVSSLHTLKDEAQKEFKKVEGQVEYRLMLITSRETKLSQLQLKLNAHILNVCKLSYDNSSIEANRMTLVE
jgi:hypothetical protein